MGPRRLVGVEGKRNRIHFFPDGSRRSSDRRLAREGEYNNDCESRAVQRKCIDREGPRKGEQTGKRYSVKKRHPRMRETATVTGKGDRSGRRVQLHRALSN